MLHVGIRVVSNFSKAFVVVKVEGMKNFFIVLVEKILGVL
jgi:hypothetical protein